MACRQTMAAPSPSSLYARGTPRASISRKGADAPSARRASAPMTPSSPHHRLEARLFGDAPEPGGNFRIVVQFVSTLMRDMRIREERNVGDAVRAGEKWRACELAFHRVGRRVSFLHRLGDLSLPFVLFFQEVHPE